MPFDGGETSQFRLVPETQPAPLAARALKWTKWLAASLLGGPRIGKVTMLMPAHVPDTPEAAVVQLLRTSRTLIEDEGKWIQGRYWTLNGRHCAMGALRVAGRLYGHDVMQRAHDHLRRAAWERGFDSVVKMNDCSSHPDVIEAFDDAITAAEFHMFASRTSVSRAMA
jgi:hypothetical protein